MVVRRSNEHGAETGGFDCRAGEGAARGGTQLAVHHANGAGRSVGGLYRCVFSEMRSPVPTRKMAALWICVWSIVAAAAMQAFASPPQHQQDTQGAPAVQNALRAGTSEDSKPREEADAVWKEPKEGASTSLSGLARDFVGDQKAIWTSPAHLRFVDAEWLGRFAGITAGLLVTDRQVSGHLPRDLKTQQHYRSIANDGSYALVGLGGGLALWSTISHNPHQRETGFLAGEAAIDSFVLTEGLKYITGRDRPYQGNGAGHFLQGGTSFPSEHAAAVWSIAGIIAHEYPGRLPKLLAYGLGSAGAVLRT